MHIIRMQQLFYVFCTLLLLPCYTVAKMETDSNEDQFLLEVDDSVNLSEGVRLNVNNNISMVDSIDASRGNIIKSGERFIHNFGTDNTFVGKRAGNFRLTGFNNTGIGADALRPLSTGNRNTAVGKSSLRQCTSGSQNVAVGFRALRLNTSGSDNVAIGDNAISINTNGSSNTAVGRRALRILTAGSSNIAIGSDAGEILTSGNKNIYIGSSGLSSESNTIRVGSSQEACYIAGIARQSIMGTPVLIDGTGQLGTNASSRRFKRAINDMNNESERVYELTPVTFIYNHDETATRQFGLIAEEVDLIFPELVAHDNDGAPYTVRYEVLPVLLLNEMKKQKCEINQLRQDVEDIQLLRQAVIDLQEKVERFLINN